MRSIASDWNLRKAAAVALSVCALLAATSAMAQDKGGKIDATEDQLQELREQMKQLDRDLQSDLERRDALRAELQKAEREVAAAAARKREADAAVARQARAVAAAEAEFERAQAQWLADREQLQAQMRASYRSGASSRVRMLLNVDDPRDVDRMLVYYDHYAAARAKSLKALRTQAEALDVVRRQLAEDLAQLEIQRKAQAAALAALVAARKSRGEALDDVVQKLAGGKQQRKQLQSEEQQLRKLLASLRAAMRSTPAPRGTALPQFKGKLPWPLRGKLLAKFGDSKGVGNLEWNGVWIAAEEGAPVRAVAAGRVVYVGWLQRFGQILILDHDGQYLSLYGHNQSVRPQVGQSVAAGEVVAEAGNSGGHEQSGVYFEIRRGATAVDPKNWLAP